MFAKNKLVRLIGSWKVRLAWFGWVKVVDFDHFSLVKTVGLVRFGQLGYLLSELVD